MRPRATYRLQLHAGVPFAAAAERFDDLETLGIDCLYLSPILQARAGSRHGYDVCDPLRVSADLGGEAAWLAFAREAKRRGFAILLDVVPCHMHCGLENPYFRDVLARGPSSRYAHWFDVDWDRRAKDGGEAVVLPWLDLPFEEALRSGEIRIARDGIDVRGMRLPLADAPSTGDDLRTLLRAQHWRVVDWKTEGAQRNYRRYLDIDDLIGLRTSRADVVLETHARYFEWIDAGLVDGLRIDHADGLADPARYLETLHGALSREASARTWIVLEKALPRGASLPASWRCDGTVGYDFLDATTRLFVDAAGLRALDAAYESFGGAAARRPGFARELKREVFDERFAAECEALAPGDAAARAFVAGEDDDFAATDRLAALRLGVAVKALEDRRAYRDARLLALNEPGGDPRPDDADLGPAAFLRFLALDRRGSLNATSTHDTKRGEDARLRLCALSDLAPRFAALMQRWSDANGRAHPPIDARTGWLLVQSLLGAWREGEPLRDRFRAFATKAAREAGTSTSWIAPNAAYEAAVLAHAGALVDRIEDGEGIGRDLRALANDLAFFGVLNALASTLLKCAAPGIPDVYQGSERFDLSLVDPDNRRPVDFDAGAALLHDDRTLAERKHSWTDGGLKQHVLRRCLEARRADRDLFEQGACIPLQVEGAPNIVAFARVLDGRAAIAIAGLHLASRLDSPRWPAAADWGNARLVLPPGITPPRIDALTGARIEATGIGECLAQLPVALLT